MSEEKLARRKLLQAGLSLGVAAVAAPALTWARAVESPEPQGHGGTYPLPPELKVLNSKEYGQRRIKRFQDGIKKAGLDAMIISNRSFQYVGYVSNYHPSGMQPGIAFVPAEGAPILFVQMYSSAHARVAKRTIWIDEVVDVPRDPVSESSSLNFYKELISAIKSRNLGRGRLGLAGGEVDWMLPPFFKENLPDCHVEDADTLLWKLVVTRDEVELPIMKWTAKVSDEVAVPLIKKMLVPGNLDREIFTEVLYSLMKAGADNPRLILGAAPYSAGIWATPPQDRAIQKGDIVLCEPIVPLRYYQTERMYTFAIGKPSAIPESQKRGAQVIYESFQIVMDEMKPGRELRDIYVKANNHIKSKGYPEGSTVLIGHFIGTDNHEGGRITEEGTKGIVLEPGMVISWHPNVVVPGDGGVRTICSSSLLITDKGVEMMSKLPMEPIVYL